MDYVEVRLENCLVRKIREQIKKEYGGKKEFAIKTNLNLEELTTGLANNKMCVRQLCYILHNLSLSTYCYYIDQWAIEMTKKNIKNSGEKYWMIENKLNIAINSLSSAFSKGYLLENAELYLVEHGYYSSFTFPKNPDKWYTVEECKKVKSVFVYILKKLSNFELSMLYTNMDIYKALNNVYWEFICQIQTLSEIDIMNLKEVFKSFVQYKNPESQMFLNVKDITIEKNYTDKWRENTIEKCCLYFDQRYPDKIEYYRALTNLFPLLPHIFSLNSDDWILLSEFSSLVNYDIKGRYHVPIILSKMIDGYTWDRNRPPYCIIGNKETIHIVGEFNKHREK